MRSGTFRVSPSCSLRAKKHALAKSVHDVFDCMAAHFSEINYVNFVITVFPTLYNFSIIKEVLQFAAINLEK